MGALVTIWSISFRSSVGITVVHEPRDHRFEFRCYWLFVHAIMCGHGCRPTYARVIHVSIISGVPANTSHWTNADLLLVQRRRRWANIKSTLVQRLVFSGVLIATWILKPDPGIQDQRIRFRPSSCQNTDPKDTLKLKRARFQVILSNFGIFLFNSTKVSERRSGWPHLFPDNTMRWPDAGLMLGQHRSRWANINPKLGDPSYV